MYLFPAPQVTPASETLRLRPTLSEGSQVVLAISPAVQRSASPLPSVAMANVSRTFSTQSV
jgi:hypothetical protein